MRHSKCEPFTDAAVEKIEQRRKSLNLTRGDLLSRFADALTNAAGARASGSAKMRLDRVLNPRMRRPVSDGTKAALANALRWTLAEFDQHVLRAAKPTCSKRGQKTTEEREETRQLCTAVKSLESVAMSLTETSARLAAIVEELAKRS